MLEIYIREQVEGQLREYKKDNSLWHIYSAFEILAKSTPPVDCRERVDWVNDLLKLYRKVASNLPKGEDERDDKSAFEAGEKSDTEKLEVLLRKIGDI
ncbi:MAG: hypothetical protein AABX71_01815 [Nanoarchaeota archaeon]